MDSAEWLARIEGGLVGLLVGGALGMPDEFHLIETIPPLAEIEYAPHVGYPRARRDAARYLVR
jgi:hypothetical protein